jgi:hypothetical protein
MRRMRHLEQWKKMPMHINCLKENLKERDHLEHMGRDRRIMLK